MAGFVVREKAKGRLVWGELPRVRVAEPRNLLERVAIPVARWVLRHPLPMHAGLWVLLLAAGFVGGAVWGWVWAP